MAGTPKKFKKFSLPKLPSFLRQRKAKEKGAFKLKRMRKRIR